MVELDGVQKVKSPDSLPDKLFLLEKEKTSLKVTII